MSPLNGFGRYVPGRSLHHHHHHHHHHQRLSQDSFSGRSTPDNHSFVSLSRYAGEGLHSPDVPGEHDDVLDRLTPSEADSSYTRPPPSTVSGVPHSSRVWSYLQDHPQLMGSPRSPPSLPEPAYPGPPSPPSSAAQPPRLLRPNPFSAPQLHPHEFHHRGEMNLHPSVTATTPDGLPNGSALNDFDEELSSYHEHSSRHDPGYRRASLPISSVADMPPIGYASPTMPTTANANANANATESSNKKWDFKYPRSRRGYRGKGSGGGNGHDTRGRMSPYTSSDMERFMPTSPYPNHLEDSLHGHAVGPTVAADPAKKASIPGTRTRRSSSRSPVKLSSPVPIEPSPPHPHSSHPYHHPPQSPHKPHPSLPHPDSYDDEDDPDNGAKAASGGSRSGSKMSSSLGSRSDFDHEERQATGLPSSTQLRGGAGGGDRDRDSSCTSPEPERSTTSRSNLRLNLSSMHTPLPPYEQKPSHTVHNSQHHHHQQHQKHQYQSLAVDQKLRSHSLHTTEDMERGGKAQLHSSGPSSPVRFATASSSSLGHTQPDSQDSMDSENYIPTRGYEVPRLEVAHDVRLSPTRPVTSELGSPMAEASLTVQNGNSSSPRKKSTASVHSNGSSAPQNKSGSNNISPTGNISGNLTHKVVPLSTTSSGIESLQRTTQGALSESALKSVEALNGIKQSINKAITFEQQLKALAESGSSDQDSDSEPHASQGLTIPQHEQQKISDKMKTAVPPQQIMVRLTKPPTTSSFGFSVADGQYDQGVYVKAVKPGGPADGSNGLRSYDRIVKVR